MDHLKQLSTFTEIVSRGSLSAAARAEGVAPSLIGRRMDALERRLGVKLLQRSTRKIALTNEGQSFLEDCQRILSELSAAEAAISAHHASPTGRLVISAPAGFGRQHVAPLIPSFLAEHPQLQVSLHLSDQFVDLISDTVDMAIRIATLNDSSLVGVKLATNQRIVVATPDYLQRHGTPKRIEDLSRHNCLTLNNDGNQRGWRFQVDGQAVTLRVQGNMACTDGAVLHDWALAGKGLAWRSIWEVGREISEGKLVPVLDDFAAPDHDIYAVVAQKRHMPRRTRVFIDFLKHAYLAPGYWKN